MGWGLAAEVDVSVEVEYVAVDGVGPGPGITRFFACDGVLGGGVCEMFGLFVVFVFVEACA